MNVHKRLSRLGATRPARVIAMAVAVAAVLLSACSGLAGGAPAAPALLPTRTLAPIRTVAPVTPDPTQPPAPTSAAPSSGADSQIATPAPTRVSSMTSCSSLKLDAGATSATTKVASAAGRIVYVTIDGNIGVSDVAGKNVIEVTSDANTDASKGAFRIYTFPTFSGDGKSLAFVSYATISGTQTATQTLYVTTPEQKAKTLKLYTTSDDSIPYLDWSPDGKQIAFLTIRSGKGAMRMISKDGGKATVIEEGSSAYWHWRADSTALMTHLSGSPATSADAHMSIADAKGANPKKITSLPGNFKAPQFSPNSKYLLFVARTGGDDDLVISDATGKPLCSLAVLEAGASFAWSPDGQRIAWISSSLTLQNPAPLSIFDLTTGATTQAHDEAIAFFWSPDSRHIAVYSVVTDGVPTEFNAAGKVDEQASIAAQAGSQMLRIEIVDAAVGGAKPIEVADTAPTSAVIDVMGFFDQYSRAVTPWSPDGKQLVYTTVSHQQSRMDLVVATLSSAADKVALSRLTDGVLAFWSPR